jgi:hypothetical protein
MESGENHESQEQQFLAIFGEADRKYGGKYGDKYGGYVS